jgi:hypothetical protein
MPLPKKLLLVSGGSTELSDRSVELVQATLV